MQRKGRAALSMLPEARVRQADRLGGSVRDIGRAGISGEKLDGVYGRTLIQYHLGDSEGTSQQRTRKRNDSASILHSETVSRGSEQTG